MTADETPKLRVWVDVWSGKPSPHMSVTRVDGKPYGIDQLLDQGQWWRGVTGTWHHIPEMDLDHARNLQRWLDRRAEVLKFRYELAFATGPQPMGDMATDGFLSALDELMDENADKWLHSTKLYQAVSARAAVADQ